MPDPGTIDDVIRESAKGPKRARGDSGEVEKYDLKDLIDADRYLDGAEAVELPHRGLRFTKLVPPGTN